MEFIFPTEQINYSNPGSGIYQLRFDSGWFYIGSSKNLYRRMYEWKTHISNLKGTDNLFLNIKEVVNLSNCVHFEVLELVNSIDILLEKETDYIVNNWNNHLLINMCKSSRKGASKDFTKTIKIVYKLDNKMNIIDKYKNHYLAADSIGCSNKVMLNALSGLNKKINGFFFKYA